jgi:hypothetical protein
MAGAGAAAKKYELPLPEAAIATNTLTPIRHAELVSASIVPPIKGLAMTRNGP